MMWGLHIFYGEIFFMGEGELFRTVSACTNWIHVYYELKPLKEIINLLLSNFVSF